MGLRRENHLHRGTEEHREMLGSISTLARSFHHGGHEVSRRNERLEAMGWGRTLENHHHRGHRGTQGNAGSISTSAGSFHHEGHEVSRRDERLEAMGMGLDTRKPSPQRGQSTQKNAELRRCGARVRLVRPIRYACGCGEDVVAGRQGEISCN